LKTQAIIISFVAILLSNCAQKSVYDKETSTLDSLKIVLQVKRNELNKFDKAIESISAYKLKTYGAFLKSNLKDTINKNQANTLQIFLNAVEALTEFEKMRAPLASQTEISITQLQTLSADLKANLIQSDQATRFITNEKHNADRQISILEQTIKTLNISIINIRNYLPKTEDLIKQINGGKLPSVVSDSLAD